ncbi:hypothetical protein BDN67DRAFT_916059, partial [Paxillus ammoniavirescens]
FGELLAMYVRLEESSGFAMEKGAAYALSSKAQPNTIHWWILCAQNGHPPIQQVDKFSNEVWSWWHGLQPTWRTLPVPTNSQDIPQLCKISGDWNEPNKPGLNRFLSVVVALNWWGAEVNRKGWQVSFWEATVEDIQ